LASIILNTMHDRSVYRRMLSLLGEMAVNTAPKP
jgi:hypothetical protein